MVAVRVGRVERLTPRAPFAAAAVAWVALVAMGLSRTHPPGLATSFLMWNVMMAAMMLPSLTPWLGLFGPREGARFAAGYFGVWSVYCLAAAIAQVYFRDGVAFSGTASASVLIVAGLYQFTPMKQACLRKCRSPLGQLLTRWRSGKSFPLRIGAAHGLNCLGCCWALMAVAFAVGVMNFWWMAALTVLLVAEKTFPLGERISRYTGAALVLAGVTALLLATFL